MIKFIQAIASGSPCATASADLPSGKNSGSSQAADGDTSAADAASEHLVDSGASAVHGLQNDAAADAQAVDVVGVSAAGAAEAFAMSVTFWRCFTGQKGKIDICYDFSLSSLSMIIRRIDCPISRKCMICPFTQCTTWGPAGPQTADPKNVVGALTDPKKCDWSLTDPMKLN